MKSLLQCLTATLQLTTATPLLNSAARVVKLLLLVTGTELVVIHMQCCSKRWLDYQLEHNHSKGMLQPAQTPKQLTADLPVLCVNPYEGPAHKVGHDCCVQPVGDHNLAQGDDVHSSLQT
jgi:hypothetical protein